jgi:hypothetical protein
MEMRDAAKVNMFFFGNHAATALIRSSSWRKTGARGDDASLPTKY